MHVEKDDEQDDDAEGGNTSCCGYGQSNTTEDFCCSADPNQSIRMGVMVGHDLKIKVWMPEVIHAAYHIEEGLQENADGTQRHKNLGLSGEYTMTWMCFKRELRPGLSSLSASRAVNRTSDGLLRIKS